jgi:hypothetical protein
VLYKYLDAKGALRFLEQPQLLFRDWRKLDDSMEVVPGFRPLTIFEIRQAAAQKFQDLQMAGTPISYDKCMALYQAVSEIDRSYLEMQMREFLTEQDCTLFVCSMSERRDSGAMWAHYAENQRGLVFGISSVVQRLVTDKSCSRKQISYSAVRPQIAFPIVDNEALLSAIYTKCEDWSYQKEWRLLRNKAEPILLQHSEVEEIVIGAAADPKVKELAVSYKRLGVRVFQAYPHPAEHRVAAKKL